MIQQLYQQKCTACRRDSPHVTSEEISQLKPEIPDWDLFNDNEIPKLDRSFKFRNFEQALAFTNAIGQLAEGEGHHQTPAISVPNGFGKYGLPTGIQFMGRCYNENAILGIAHAYQSNTRWHQMYPPNGNPTSE